MCACEAGLKIDGIRVVVPTLLPIYNMENERLTIEKVTDLHSDFIFEICECGI